MTPPDPAAAEPAAPEPAAPDPSVLAAAFTRRFGRPPAGVWAAPGRVNLIGEHTDYNDGLVLPLALQHQVAIAAAPAAAGHSTVVSVQRPDAAEPFAAATVAPGQVSGWAAYPAGVFWALAEAGHRLPDLDLLVDGTVPPGAGLSSSAALECATAVALNDLAGLGLGATDLALLARRAENGFVGVPTGIMDQLASMHGRAGHLVALDTRDLSVEHVPFPLARHGLALLVIDTRAPHALVDSEYGQRRADCEHAVAALGVASLREVTVPQLDAVLTRLPDDVTRRRVRHVVTETDRVAQVIGLLRSGADPRGIGPLLTASHLSLRDDYQVTIPQLDVAVDAALAAGAAGARMTGGGFGGCVIALVEAPSVDAVAGAVAAAFADAGFTPPEHFVATPSAGASRVV